MFHRPLGVLVGLTLGDYLLWNWSLNGSLSGSRDVLALVSGLTLPPLAIACLWLLVLSIVRTVAHSKWRTRLDLDGERLGVTGTRRAADRRRASSAARSNGPAAPIGKDGAPGTATIAPSSDKLAA